MNLTAAQLRALRLLGKQGGARYGTQIAAMRELKAKGLARSHDTGKKGAGRWTWRPTEAGRKLLTTLEAAS